VQNRGIVVPTAMTEPADQELIDLLVAREGIWTEVELFDGKTLRVLNIAWGYDQGDEYAHVTTNCSPSPGRRVPMDFFFTNDVTRVIDPETREVLYEGPDASSDDIDLLEKQAAIAEREERERGWSARLRRSHPNWWSVGGAAIVAVVFVARALADESDMAMPAGEFPGLLPQSLA
jgi:hypothetical protein